MAKCKSCKAAIEWAITEANGKRIPVDKMPVRDGNLVKTGATIGGLKEVHALMLGEEVPRGTPRYTAHFATCPNAKQHRQRA